MARSVQNLLDDLQDLAEFDVTDAHAVVLLNEAQRRLQRRSEWIRATTSIGPTVSGTSDYAVPSCIRILDVTVDDVPFQRESLEALQKVTAGHGYTRRYSDSGFFAPFFNSSGTEYVRLYPTPTSVLTVNAVVVSHPTAFSTGSLNATTQFPDDADEGLVVYALSKLMTYREDNPELAQLHMNRFEEIALDLRKLRTGRIGRGPRQIPVVGVHTS